MTVATTVEIGVYLNTSDAPYFRLNDPVRGKLNNTSYRLAGPIFYDITEYVYGVSIKRGRNRQLDRFSAGQANISLRNQTRIFDPLNTSSIFYGNIIPRRQIRIRSGGYNQFFGVVEDWNFDYDISGESTAQIQAADAFTLFAQQSLTAGTATAQDTGARVEAVLNMSSVAWPTDYRDIDSGVGTVGSDVWVTTDNALTYLQEVESSEQGLLFMDTRGYVRFVNRDVTPTSALSVVSFADDGTGIPYSGAQVSYGTEMLYNNVSVTYNGGTAVASNTDSQDLYGISTTSVSTLLSNSSQGNELAAFWVSKFGEPDYRFEALTVDLDGLTGTQVDDVLQTELGDIVHITFRPNGLGDPIARYGQVIGINHDASPGSHKMTFSLSSLQYAYLVLDDSGFGILDSNVLGF